MSENSGYMSVTNSPMMLLSSRRGSSRRFAGNSRIQEKTNRSSGLVNLIQNTPERNDIKPKKKSKAAPENKNNLSIDKDRISGIYNNDINILEINKIVLEKIYLENQSERLRLKELIDSELYSIKKPQNIVDRKNSVHTIKTCRIELEKINESEKLYNYIEESTPILEAYNDIGVKNEKIIFGKRNDKKTNHQLDEDDEYRIILIERYLEIASRYISLSIYKKNVNCCINCKSDLSLAVIGDDGIIVCSVCDVETVTVTQGINYDDDNSHSYKLANGGYEDRSNFIKALTKYQGKQPNNFPSNLFDKLDDYFSSINLPIGSEISELPLNNTPKSSIKTRGKTSRNIMIKALSDIEGGNSYYEDINLLCKIYWGWILPDISELEPQILADYDASQEVFDRIKGDRKSCLNIQYRLWRHLSKIGHPCLPTDFKLIKTPAIINFYENTWETICNELGWNKGHTLV